MTVICCPYCNAPVNSPLKFCVACGHALSSGDLKKLGGLKGQIKAGITKQLADTLTHASFHKSKKSYRLERGIRQFLLNFSYLLILILLFYAVAKFAASELSVARPPKSPPAPGKLFKHHRSSAPCPFPAITTIPPGSRICEL
jgi:hypothetical protein